MIFYPKFQFKFPPPASQGQGRNNKHRLGQTVSNTTNTDTRATALDILLLVNGGTDLTDQIKYMHVQSAKNDDHTFFGYIIVIRIFN